MSRDTAYRPEIDGLRCVAVIVVLMYHLQVVGFSGGFVGVDVFFVISGYLITRKIVDEIDHSGTFRFGNFYIGRIIRLYPALIITLFGSFIAAYAIFPPSLMASFAASVLSTIASVSNILFWSQSGYFDTDSIQKPLLHTWSLSLEEQFYLFWPLFLLFSYKIFTRSRIPWIIFIITILSLVSSALLVRHSSAIYFLLPFRVFELGIGATVVWAAKWKPQNNASREAVFILGITAIGISVWLYDRNTVFPSYNALLPCIGTAGVILAGKTMYISNVLTVKPVVFVGLISYPLYLVHWPIIVYYNYYVHKPMEWNDKSAIFILSFLLAVLIYYFEQFIRYSVKSGALNSSKILASTAVTATLVAVPTVHSWLDNGWEWRYPDEVLTLMSSANSNGGVSPYPYDCFLQPFRDPGSVNPLCYETDQNNGKKKVLLLGDSTVYHLADGLYTEFSGTVDLHVWAAAVCPAVHGVDSAHGNPSCRSAMDYFFSTILPKNHYDIVIAAQLFNIDAMRSGFPSTIAKFEEKGSSVILLGQPIYYSDSPANIIGRYGKIEGLRDLMKTEMLTSCSDEYGLDSLVKADRFFSIKMIMCADGYPLFETEGNLIHKDHVHLNGQGSRYVARRLVHWLRLRRLL